MPVLRIQDLVVPKRAPEISRYFNGSSPTTSDILCLRLRGNARGGFSAGASHPVATREGVLGDFLFISFLKNVRSK